MQGSENSLQGSKVAQTRPMLSVVNEKLNATAKQLADIKHETEEIQEQLRKVEQKVDSFSCCTPNDIRPSLCEEM